MNNVNNTSLGTEVSSGSRIKKVLSKLSTSKSAAGLLVLLGLLNGGTEFRERYQALFKSTATNVKPLSSPLAIVDSPVELAIFNEEITVKEPGAIPIVSLGLPVPPASSAADAVYDSFIATVEKGL